LDANNATESLYSLNVCDGDLLRCVGNACRSCRRRRMQPSSWATYLIKKCLMSSPRPSLPVCPYDKNVFVLVCTAWLVASEILLVLYFTITQCSTRSGTEKARFQREIPPLRLCSPRLCTKLAHEAFSANVAYGRLSFPLFCLFSHK